VASRCCSMHSGSFAATTATSVARRARRADRGAPSPVPRPAERLGVDPADDPARRALQRAGRAGAPDRAAQRLPRVPLRHAHGLGLEHTDDPKPLACSSAPGPTKCSSRHGDQRRHAVHGDCWGSLHLEDTVLVTADGHELLTTADLDLRCVPPEAHRHRSMPMPPSARRCCRSTSACCCGIHRHPRKLISLPALELVWWRMLIVVAVLLAWLPLWRNCGPCRLARSRLCRHRSRRRTALADFLRRNQACQRLGRGHDHGRRATVPRPHRARIARRPFDVRELVWAGRAAGVVLVVGGTPAGMQLGLAVGVLSAFLVAIFGP